MGSINGMRRLPTLRTPCPRAVWGTKNPAGAGVFVTTRLPYRVCGRRDPDDVADLEHAVEVTALAGYVGALGGNSRPLRGWRISLPGEA